MLLLGWVIIVKEPEAPPAPAGGSVQAKGQLAKVLKSPNMWKVMFCSGFAVGSSILINTYLTQAFSANGASVEMASTIGTVLNLCLILGGILSGAVIGKLGKINIPYAFICIVGGRALPARLPDARRARSPTCSWPSPASSAPAASA